MSVKVTLKYDEAEDKDRHMTLRLTLPGKYVDGVTKEVVKLFVGHYNKKHSEHPLDTEALHLKIVGGDHLDHAASVRDTINNGDECYIFSNYGPSASEIAAAAARAAASAPPAPKADIPAAPVAPKKREDGKVRCKRFGCQQYFDPEGPPNPCRHHKSPPIFHEIAKWWSCCQDKKAYDFDEFMKIPGCEEGFCSTDPEGQSQKRFLGGCDLRGDSAPVRLDANAGPDSKQKLMHLRKGFLAIGVDGDLFNTVCNSLHEKFGGDVDKICGELAKRASGVLTEVAAS